MYRYEIKDPAALTDAPNNSRTHSEQQILEIVKSIQEWGFTNPLLIDPNGEVIAGHGRKMAALRLGLTEVPCIILDGLTKIQKQAYLIADNQLALTASWDFDLLKSELLDLKNVDFDLSLIGFDDSFLDGLMVEQTPGLVPEDDVPAITEQPITVMGDLWLLGSHRVLCGDATSIDAVDKLMCGEKVDMVFTDPPYGYSYESNHQTKHKMLTNDDKILDFFPVMIMAMNDDSVAYVCGSHQTIDEFKPLFSNNLNYKNMIVWKKNNWSMGDLKGSYAGQHELILFGSQGRVKMLGNRDSDVWEFNREPPKDHPTQKPIDLIVYAMSKFKSHMVLDLFGGSGSTLIACEKTNRHCRMMELDEKYCDVIIKRWQDFTGQEAIHLDTCQTYNQMKAERDNAVG